MISASKGLQQSALVMKISGWGVIAFMALVPFLYAPGVLLGLVPAWFPIIGPAHSFGVLLIECQVHGGGYFSPALWKRRRFPQRHRASAAHEARQKVNSPALIHGTAW
jgi:hypothetical protein